jgi:transposase-like protein
VEDRTAGPAEIAAARIDWAAWLRSMSRRQRAIACLLARGETTGAVARKFRISAVRISQLRTWFRENWEQFHGQTPGGKVLRRSTLA